MKTKKTGVKGKEVCKGEKIVKNRSGYLRDIMETATLKLLDDISILAFKIRPCPQP